MDRVLGVVCVVGSGVLLILLCIVDSSFVL